MLRSTRSFFVLLAALTASACDTTGVHELRLERDVVDACSNLTSTWLRTTTDGTEIYLLGSSDPVGVVTAATQLCFSHAVIKGDSTTDMEYGTYTLDASGNGTFTQTVGYTFPYQPSRGILSRSGSSRTDLTKPPATPILHPLQIATSGAEILLTQDGTVRRLTNLYDVVAAVDPTTQAGAEDMYRLLNLELFISQVRVEGFGSGRMTMYANITANFQALISNNFTLSVASFANPDTTFAYYQFQDLSGIVLDGVQVTDIQGPSINGNGVMTGVLDWSMRSGPTAQDVRIIGTVDYANLTIGNGLAAGGYYLVNTTMPSVTSHQIPFGLAADTRLPNLLPPSVP